MSKTNEKQKKPEDKTIRIGRIDNKMRFGDLTDKQLKNIAHWEELTDREKKNRRRNRIILSGSSAVVDGALGTIKGGLGGGILGAGVEAGVGMGISKAADIKHPRQAKIAKEVLENRKQESIMKEKDFSFSSKLKSASKGAWTGAQVGAILTPGNIILALCGKKKAALIMTGIGAGIGAGIGFYYGWKGGKKEEEFKEKLKTDPKFQEKEKKKLQEYMKTSLQDLSNSWRVSDFKNSGIPYRPDFYQYVNLYNQFTKKYGKEWIGAWKNLKSTSEIDEDFGIVFPKPYHIFDNDGMYDEETGWYVAANGDVEWNGSVPQDHYWIMWDPDRQEYNNNLGSGLGTGDTLLEASQNFASQWIVNESKIKDPGILEVARIHNKIIREFCKLR